MPIIDLASSKSVWRGLEYYKQNKVLSCERNDDGTYEGIVSGNGKDNYRIHLDIAHPRRSSCNCPLAKGKKTICKHIVAVSFCADPTEADRFQKEKTVYASEEEERRAKRYSTLMRFTKKMSKTELAKAYAEAMVELEEIRYKESQG